MSSSTLPSSLPGIAPATPGLSRRAALGRLLAGGCALPGLGLPGPAFASLAAMTAPPPRQGGYLRVASAAAAITDTLDPARQSNQTDYIRGKMFYNGLTELDAHLNPLPALAESFASEDAQEWTFRLRRGVAFHDGKPLTPADVVYSLMRHKDPAVGSKANAIAAQIDSVIADGPQAVKVRLKAPNADLPVLMGTFHFHIVADGTTDFRLANGTGPYRCQEFRPGVRSIAVRNPDYWKPGRPYVDTIECVGIVDEVARVNALLSGDIDLVSAVNPRSALRIAATPGFTFMTTQSGQYSDLVMRQDRGPGANPDFVLALKYLMDRELMMKVIAQGHAMVGNDQPIDPTHTFYAAGLPQRAYDPERARFHLRKAGMEGARLPIVASPAATYSVEIALVLQHAAARAGLNLEVKRMPVDGYWSNHWMKHPLSFGNINPRASADAVFTQFYQSSSAWNTTGWKNPRFDQLLVAARSELDENRRRALYADMQALVHDECGSGIPLFIASIDGLSSRVKGLSQIPLGGLMGYSFAENVWLEG